MTYRIDANGKKIGRVAGEAAAALLGKHTTTFTKNKVTEGEVVVTNCAKMDLPTRRLATLSQRRYSGYPGGLKIVPAQNVITKKGAGELLRLIVRGMLPKNTLRDKRLKKLVTTE